MAETKMVSFESEVDRKGGMECEAKMGDFSLTIDEPKHMGGNDKGPNPLEVLLSALGGCLNTAGTVVAREMDLDLKDFKLKIDGKLDPRGFRGDPDVPSGFQEITVKIEEIDGIPEEKMDEFLEQIKNRCPVEGTLESSLEVEMER